MDQGHWPTDVKVVICGHTIPQDVRKISSSLETFLFAKSSCYLCVSQLLLIASIGSAVHTTLLANEIKSNQQKDKLHNIRAAVHCKLYTVHCTLYTVHCVVFTKVGNDSCVVEISSPLPRLAPALRKLFFICPLSRLPSFFLLFNIIPSLFVYFSGSLILPGY